MLIYFDESYNIPNTKYLILGALFNPHSKFLHRRLTEIKRENRFTNVNWSLKEIKYNYCKTREYYGDIFK